MNATIKDIIGEEILDSRGNPTIKVKVSLEDGSWGEAAVPSGASTGKYEAWELRDNDTTRQNGKGVSKALANINGEIRENLIGQSPNQEELDTKIISLDGTKNKERLGANATLGVSLAFAKARAQSAGKELYESLGVSLPKSLPLPMFNILNGGRHAENSTDIQEFMIVPIGAKDFAEALDWGEKICASLGEILESRGLGTRLGDEGGYAPQLNQNAQALDLLIEAIEKSHFLAGEQIALALDIAASELKNGEIYELKREQRNFSSTELIAWYEELVKKYPIISIEDGLDEDDWSAWQIMTKQLGSKINLVGDDLFVTNPDRLALGIKEGVANAIIIKPNQIGTLTETLKVIKLAQGAGYKIIVSHRSGETEDTTIADLAVAVGAEFLKSGAPTRPERLAKYHRLAEIEKKLS